MFSKGLHHIFMLAISIAVAGTVSASAQTKKAKNTKRTPSPPATVAAKAEEPGTETSRPEPEPAGKRNSRPVETSGPAVAATATQTSGPLYTYEFTQPDFITSRILIEHDETGKGKMSFQRRGNAEVFTESVTISETALAKLKGAFNELNFLDSTENYQHAKDFSNMGNSRITLTNGQRSRSVTLNYTLNKNAKILMDEYRKVGNQTLWMFDVIIARENQPLDGPSQMEALDSLLRRNEISDPRQLLPFLRELSDDERLPLIARNHATRIVQQIERAKK